MTLPDAAARAEGRAPARLLVFLALMTSLVALTIDAVLPALDAMDRDVGFADANDRQLVVMAVFAGLALAQAVVGPLADALGRRAVALGGLALYVVGGLVCLAATEAWALLAGRFLQGLGAAGPRVVAVAIVRDLYEGRPMARVLSLVNTIFISVPMLAPLVGQGIEAAGGWRAIFVFYAAAGVATALWYLAGVPETLPRARRRPLAPRRLIAGYAEVLTTRRTVLCTVVTACAFGSFVAYLATAQQVFEELYALGALFPLAFAALAAAFAAASFLNGRLVMRLGMRRLSTLALRNMAATGAAGAALSFGYGGVPPLWLAMALLAVVFVSVASIFANMIALATEPVGHLAGTATSVVLAASTLGATLLGTLIAQGYDGSLTPLFAGFATLGLAGALVFALVLRLEAGETAAAGP